jgi:hypothetical protein
MMNPLLSELLASQRQSPGHIALALHMSGSEALKEAPLNAAIATQSDDSNEHVGAQDQMMFGSLADRNQALAVYLCDALKAKGNFGHDDVYGITHELWRKEIGRSDRASVRFVAEVSRHEDVLKLAADHIRSGARTFDVLRVLDAYLPYASDLCIGSLIDLARAQHEGTKRDMMSGLLYGALEKWLVRHPASAYKLLNEAVDSADEVTANLINVALIGISHSEPDEAVVLGFQLLVSENEFVRKIARWTLGVLLRLNLMSEEKLQEVEQLILANLRDEDPDVQLDALRAATGAMHISTAFDKALDELAQASHQGALISIATALFLKDAELDEQGRFYVWLPALVAIEPSPSNKDTLGGLDHVLQKRLGDQHEGKQQVIDFLTSWAQRHGDAAPINGSFVSTFDGCTFEIAGQPLLLARVVTEWLWNGDRRLASAAAGMLSELEVRGFEEVQLDAGVASALAPLGLKFLIVRMLGFMHSAKHLISMSISLLKMDQVAIERALPLLRWLMVEEVGYDYPGSTSTALAKAVESEERSLVRAAIQQWQSEIDSAQDLLEKLPRLNEFRSPSQLRRQFALARGKQMSRSTEQASEQSIWRQIATQVPIKAGRGFFNHSHGQYSNATNLHTFSYSVELPRREVLDPVGYAHRGFRFRNSKKGE